MLCGEQGNEGLPCFALDAITVGEEKKNPGELF